MENYALPKRKVDVGSRLASMVLDHFFMTLIAFVFGIPVVIYMFRHAMDSGDQPNFQFLLSPLMFVALFGYSLYFCKDCIQGRSLAKRIMKLQVINNATGAVASPIRCFIRNFFCIIWPIEFIAVLINPERRIGDFVAGTRIDYFDPTISQPRPLRASLILPILLSYALCCSPIFLFQNMISAARIIYVEGSYNPTESLELEMLLNDSLGRALKADVRIYDKVEKRDVKYVSVICKLKENYLEDEGTIKQLRNTVKQLVYSKFPKNTITGRAKYIYSEPGHFQSSTENLGRRISDEN